MGQGEFSQRGVLNNQVQHVCQLGRTELNMLNCFPRGFTFYAYTRVFIITGKQTQLKSLDKRNATIALKGFVKCLNTF